MSHVVFYVSKSGWGFYFSPCLTVSTQWMVIFSSIQKQPQYCFPFFIHVTNVSKCVMWRFFKISTSHILTQKTKKAGAAGGGDPKGGNIRRVIELLWESESSAAQPKKKVVVVFFFFVLFFIPCRAIFTIKCHRLQIVCKLGVVQDSAEGGRQNSRCVIMQGWNNSTSGQQSA